MKSLFSYIGLPCYVIFSMACHRSLSPQTSVIGPETIDPKGNVQLVGKASRQRLEKPPFSEWYNKNYGSYVVDSSLTGRLRTALEGKRIVIFMGTWCGDSKREVPRLFKILDCCGVDTAAVELITVSNSAAQYKQSPGHEERGRDIFRVPDFILMDREQELGRIVESPVASLEKDLLSIALGEHYVPKYPGEALLAEIFHREKTKSIRKQLPGLTEKLRPLVTSPGELISYAHVLDAAGDKEKSGLVLELKDRLFPNG